MEELRPQNLGGWAAWRGEVDCGGVCTGGESYTRAIAAGTGSWVHSCPSYENTKMALKVLLSGQPRRVAFLGRRVQLGVPGAKGGKGAPGMARSC